MAHVYFICCRDRNSSKAAKRPQQEAAIYVRFEDAKAELRLRVAEGGNSEEKGGPEWKLNLFLEFMEKKNRRKLTNRFVTCKSRHNIYIKLNWSKIVWQHKQWSGNECSSCCSCCSRCLCCCCCWQHIINSSADSALSHGLAFHAVQFIKRRGQSET